jgi:uncharacterized protein (TIGR03067 family)
MFRRLLLLCAVVLLLPLFAFDAPREYDDTTVPANDIEGVWQFVSVEYSGQTFPGTIHISFQKGKYSWGDSEPTLKGYYVVDTNRKPCWIDMTTTSISSGNPTMKAIYVFEGDTLKVANGPRALDRPEGFDTKNHPGVAVWTLKRVK